MLEKRALAPCFPEIESVLYPSLWLELDGMEKRFKLFERTPTPSMARMTVAARVTAITLH